MMTPVKMLNCSKYRTHSFIAEIFEGEEKMTSVARMNCAPRTFNPALELPKGFMDFLLPLNKASPPGPRALGADGAEGPGRPHNGRLPGHRESSEATTGAWMIDLPEWAQDQRNQMTGPADDAELVVKMLNSGAPGVMLD